MTNNLLKINSPAETRKITSFIKNTLKREGFEKVIIGLSGGIDSATSFYLLKQAIAPQNIIAAHLYYFESQIKDIEPMLKQAGIPKENIYEISIAPMVSTFEVGLRLRHTSKVNRVRLGNIMARVRMIILYDIAKKNNAMVCGTENKSEALLGYFTRFGDEASDIEPIQHLYKTQVYQLAKYLKVPDEIIKKPPTAGLWTGQTDEKDFGFSYQEADLVLHLYFEKKVSVTEISKEIPAAKKIIDRVNENSFKHSLPYKIKEKIPSTKLQITNKLE